jgi:hypothetical protein
MLQPILERRESQDQLGLAERLGDFGSNALLAANRFMYILAGKKYVQHTGSSSNSSIPDALGDWIKNFRRRPWRRLGVLEGTAETTDI